eukprot:CAMPEP_0183334348 /NCGR_PEP_ID=MMETSP0164_2-20130417/2973_1 /TAXON_ID=221442 /ORGANISM="Coccolithus pelagicus ssp braarudi, Strain PLY182g" /LENGTH=115 /DNA_ID=CAMNT_0025503467 /DNA_START=436 /DNA_END=783 /DNA_ORIENTATION=+
MKAPRVGHEERAKHVEAVHRRPAKDVKQVGLCDTVAANSEREAGSKAKDDRWHLLADAQNRRWRVVLVAPPHVLRLKLGNNRTRTRGERAAAERRRLGNGGKSSARAKQREDKAE